VIPFFRPSLGEEEAAAAARVVRSGWVMQGPEVAAFEAELAALVGAPHAAAVSSGTAGLELALLALGLGPGDEVITASHSFIATANAVSLVGARPVFADVDEQLNLDPDEVARAITPRTRAILCVHQLGVPSDLARLAALAAAHRLALVEDAACALGSAIRLDGAFQPIGRPAGDAAVFSFHPRKVITTGEGGMVTTRDPALDERVRLHRQHGMASPSAPATLRGRNLRLTDVQAAIGRRQLARLPALLDERRRLAARYDRLLEGLPLARPRPPDWTRANWQSYHVTLAEGRSGSEVAAALEARGIGARGGLTNAHEQPAYAESHAGVRLPRSEALRARGLLLPLYPGLDEDAPARVAAALREILEKAQ
jgi:dTDP-4-amino-4,6-dideoxygalactose transaminase